MGTKKQPTCQGSLNLFSSTSGCVVCACGSKNVCVWSSREAQTHRAHCVDCGRKRTYNIKRAYRPSRGAS